jgi:hypothetical protein
MRQSEIFSKRPSKKSVRSLLAFDGIQCRLVTGSIIGHYTCHLHVMGLLQEMWAGEEFLTTYFVNIQLWLCFIGADNG